MRVVPACQDLGADQAAAIQGHLGLVVGFELAVVEAAHHVRHGGQLGDFDLSRQVLATSVVASQQGGDPLQAEWLAKVAEKIEAQALDHRNGGLAQDGIHLAAEDHRMDLAAQACVAKERQAVHAAHLQVADGDVDVSAGLQDRHRLLAVRRLEDRSGHHFLQGCDGYQALKRLILQHQNIQIIHHGPHRVSRKYRRYTAVFPLLDL